MFDLTLSGCADLTLSACLLVVSVLAVVGWRRSAPLPGAVVAFANLIGSAGLGLLAHMLPWPAAQAVVVALAAALAVASAAYIGYVLPEARRQRNPLDLQAELEHRGRVEAELRRTKARLRAIFQTVTDAVVTFGHDGRIAYFNPAAEAMFGIAVEDAHHRDVAGLFVDPIRPAQLLGRLTELTAVRDGREFPAEISLATFVDGRETFFTAVVRDTSARKQAADRFHRQQADLEAESRQRHRLEAELVTLRELQTTQSTHVSATAAAVARLEAISITLTRLAEDGHHH